MNETCQGDQKHRINRVWRERAENAMIFLCGVLIVANMLAVGLGALILAFHVFLH